MADVFISYHEKSAGELVAKIAAALENAGISCWYAKRDIPAGGDFARDIPTQIDACRVFLLILNDSVIHQSKHIENELGLAFGRLNRKEEITILPLEIGDFKRESWIKYYLLHTQTVKVVCLTEKRLQELTRKVIGILCNSDPPLNLGKVKNYHRYVEILSYIVGNILRFFVIFVFPIIIFMLLLFLLFKGKIIITFEDVNSLVNAIVGG